MFQKLLCSPPFLRKPLQHAHSKIEEYFFFIAGEFRHRIRQPLTSDKVLAEDLVCSKWSVSLYVRLIKVFCYLACDLLLSSKKGPPHT